MFQRTAASVLVLCVFGLTAVDAREPGKRAIREETPGDRIVAEAARRAAERESTPGSSRAIHAPRRSRAFVEGEHGTHATIPDARRAPGMRPSVAAPSSTPGTITADRALVVVDKLVSTEDAPVGIVEQLPANEVLLLGDIPKQPNPDWWPRVYGRPDGRSAFWPSKRSGFAR